MSEADQTLAAQWWSQDLNPELSVSMELSCFIRLPRGTWRDPGTGRSGFVTFTCCACKVSHRCTRISLSTDTSRSCHLPVCGSL